MRSFLRKNNRKGTLPKAHTTNPFLLQSIWSRWNQKKMEGSEEREISVAEMEKLKHPISCKALTKPLKDQKPPPFTRGWHNSWNHSTNSCLVFRDVIQEGITAGRLKLAEKPPLVTTDPFSQPQVNMVNLNWLEWKRGKLTTEASSSRGGRVTREANQRPKATISAGVVLCSKCKTQKRRIQRQYFTFLKNKDDIQVLPGSSSAKKGKSPEKAPQAEQTTYQPQELMKTESPDGPPINPASSSINQLEPSQIQGESEPILAEGQEDWTEEYEEEQLDYEPSADNQTALLEIGEQKDWTEEYGEEQMEYDVELDEEPEAFGAKLESLLQGDLGINMVFILPEKFRVVEGQENTLEGDVFSQESFKCKLAEVEEALAQQTPTAKTGGTAMKLAAEQLCFSKPTKVMANHLRPPFITANLGGITIPKVMIDGGATINLLPHRLLTKIGRTEKDLITTYLTVTSFAGGITKTHGILDVDVVVGTKELKIAFFVVDTTSTTYNELLGRDWIHQSVCVPSTLHQQLALWNEEGFIEIV
ncbi:unnamed protein product [Prunus armeniaca]